MPITPAAEPPVAPSAWSSREPVTALTSERLAVLVQRAATRAGEVLFTATPSAELDAIGSWQRLMDLAWAGQVRAVREAYDAVHGESAARGSFVADEVAMALGVSVRTGQSVLGEALGVTELPGLVEGVEDGVLSVRHVRAVLDVLCTTDLALHQQQLVVILALARFRGQTPGELRRLVTRLVLSVDLAAAEARKQVKNRRRNVRFTALGDDQASITATGPLAMVEAVRASLEATLPLEREKGDERSKDEREFDLMVELLTGSTTPGSWTASVVVPFSTATGGDLELAEVPGLGPVLPSTARELMDVAGETLRIAVDDEGAVLAVDRPGRSTDLAAFVGAPVVADLGSDAYRIPVRLRRFVQARDRTCTFPGCTGTAVTSDLDHRVPWPTGPTSSDNLHCLCRRHHRAKQAAFTVHLAPDGSTVWSTRGWQFVRRPLRW